MELSIPVGMRSVDVGLAGRAASDQVSAVKRRQSDSEAVDTRLATMYTYIMDRTQIYLTAEESAALERASIETGKTRSQLVREAIDERYGTRRSLEEFMAALDAARGAWKEGPGEDRSAYLKDLRRADLAKQRYLERLRRRPPATDQ